MTRLQEHAHRAGRHEALHDLGIKAASIAALAPGVIGAGLGASQSDPEHSTASALATGVGAQLGAGAGTFAGTYGGSRLADILLRASGGKAHPLVGVGGALLGGSAGALAGAITGGRLGNRIANPSSADDPLRGIPSAVGGSVVGAGLGGLAGWLSGGPTTLKPLTAAGSLNTRGPNAMLGAVAGGLAGHIAGHVLSQGNKDDMPRYY